MAETSIEWTDRVWNPVTGCTKVSQGCRHCYAETVANRFWHKQYPQVPVSTRADLDATASFHRPRKFTDVLTHKDRLAEPLKWRKPSRIFVNSMSDLFHEDVPDAFIDQVFAVMALAPQHTFQVLTKRPARMSAYLNDAALPSRLDALFLSGEYELPGGGRVALVQPHLASGFEGWPLPNVWLGVSVEDQKTADERIPLLLQTPAAVRFISAEPLLAPVDLDPLWLRSSPSSAAQSGRTSHLPLSHWTNWGTTALDWVIVGGESGHGARPCDVAWVRSIVEQCQAASVPVFVKQLGAWPFDSQGIEGFRGAIDHNADRFERLRNRKGADPSEWPEDLRVRQMPLPKRKERAK